MLQEIWPHRLDMSFGKREPRDDDYVILLRDGKALLASDDGGPRLPECGELAAARPDAADGLVHLFRIDDRAVFLSMAAPGELPGFAYEDVMIFRTLQPSWLSFAGATASHLADWYGKNRFCGSCGAGMHPKEDERALRCAACPNVVYPRISPAVIVAVTDGDRVILTRYANRPNARPALVAGFMEVGETLEDTVRREVMEEVGVRVKNIRYYKSQPWAFSGSVLVGFFADLEGPDAITLDTVELKEALWVNRRDVPPRESAIALTAEMMELFRLGKDRGWGDRAAF